MSLWEFMLIFFKPRFLVAFQWLPQVWWFSSPAPGFRSPGLGLSIGWGLLAALDSLVSQAYGAGSQAGFVWKDGTPKRCLRCVSAMSSLFSMCFCICFCDSWSDRLFAYIWVSMLKKWKIVFWTAKLIVIQESPRMFHGRIQSYICCGDCSDMCFCLRDVAMPNLRKWTDWIAHFVG